MKKSQRIAERDARAALARAQCAIIKAKEIMDTEWEKILQIVARRDHLKALRVRCPKCSTSQVQLVNWMGAPAQWKCRECKHRFEHG